MQLYSLVEFDFSIFSYLRFQTLMKMEKSLFCGREDFLNANDWKSLVNYNPGPVVARNLAAGQRESAIRLCSQATTLATAFGILSWLGIELFSSRILEINGAQVVYDTIPVFSTLTFLSLVIDNDNILPKADGRTNI